MAIIVEQPLFGVFKGVLTTQTPLFGNVRQGVARFHLITATKGAGGKPWLWSSRGRRVCRCFLSLRFRTLRHFWCNLCGTHHRRQIHQQGVFTIDLTTSPGQLQKKIYKGLINGILTANFDKEAPILGVGFNIQAEMVGDEIQIQFVTGLTTGDLAHSDF